MLVCNYLLEFYSLPIRRSMPSPAGVLALVETDQGSSPDLASNLPWEPGQINYLSLPPCVSLSIYKMGSVKHTLPTFQLPGFLRGDANEKMGINLLQ